MRATLHFSDTVRAALRGASSSSRVGGGGGGGHSLRFLTVLAGFTAVLSIPLIPHPAEAAATGNCGALPSGSGAAEVTCDDPTYTKADGPPIGYDLAAPGRSVTLTVKPSGAGTVTITSSGIPSGASDARPGIVLSGPGALKKVVLDGRVRIESGASRRLVTGLPTTVTVTRIGKAIDSRDRGAGLNHGVYVKHLGSDADAQKDRAEVMVGAEARIGTEGKPMGGYGVLAYFQHATDVGVTNAGEIYGMYAGILAHRSGEGDTVIKTAKNSVTSQGIRASAGNLQDEDLHENWLRDVWIAPGESPGGGDITIIHEGKIVVQTDPLRYLTTTTPTAFRHVEGRSSYARAGIHVFHQDKSAPAADGQASSEISITSSGDIEIVTDPGVEPRWGTRGIQVITKGDDDSVVPVTVDVTGGSIMGEGRGDAHAIQIHHEHNGGLIKVDLAGAITGAGGVSGHGDGIHVYRYRPTKPAAAVKSSGIEVTLRSGARIGVEGDEPTVGRHGVFIQQQIYGGSIRVAVSEGARIGTAGTPVGGHGVLADVIEAADEADVMVTNEGFIHAKGSGVVAVHRGSGDVVAKHLKGEIIAGDAPDIFDLLTEDHPTQLADLKSRTAGILAVHGSSRFKTPEGETFNENDPSTYTTETGKIEIASKADITSKGDGILAYVKDLDDTGDVRAGKMIIPIMIDVSGGTIMADGHGVYAETATTYDDPTEAGKIEVTVGEMATIRAKKDGVHVKGMRTFASDHARKGQYDQTVTINGKVMGGGGDYVGVRMVKGGTLVIGSGGPEARLRAASGVAVHADGALTITMSKTADGRIGWVVGKIQNGDSGDTTFAGVEVGKTYLLQDWEETKGIYDTTIERKVTLRERADEDYHEFELVSQEEIVREYHDRARVYEALPSVLLEMSAPGGRQARLSATRDGGGAWARVLASDGEREAETSTTAMDTAGHDLSWDFERWGVETGFAVPTDLPGVTLGVSAHYRDGEADVERGGKIEVSGVGVGVSATWWGEDGWYADGEFSYTRFEDVDLSSETRGMVASGLDGEGHAIGVEVGRRMEMDGFALVPRGGLTWTWVDVDGFADVSGVAGSGRASFRSEDSVRARVGALLENGQTYASLDVEREFSESREAMASGARLRSEVESTWARVGVGGVMVLDEKGESTLSGEAHYAASDGDNHDYGASVLLKVRF